MPTSLLVTEKKPTIDTVLGCDVAHIICVYLTSIEDLASLLQFWSATTTALCDNDPLHTAVRARTLSLVVSRAPLWSAASDFETVACCNGSRPFFAALCMSVSGSCQQAASPKPGVLNLLRALLATTPASDAPIPATAVVLEAIAWLHGHCGKTSAALRAWARAARAGSARAQLDLGLHKYRATGSASTVTDPDPDPNSSRDPQSLTANARESAESWLLAASRNPGLASLGLEGHVIRARSMMTLGAMALDGDGSEQDDAAAAECLESALRSVRRGSNVHLSLVALLPASTTSSASKSGSAADTLLAEDAQYIEELGAVLHEVEEDAREAMAAMGRFIYANGSGSAAARVTTG